LLRIRAAKKYLAIVPAGKAKATEAQPDLARLRRRMRGNGPRRQSNQRLQYGLRRVEQSLRLPVRHQPGILILQPQRIDFVQDVAYRIALVEFQLNITPRQSASAMRHVVRSA
jgi:hypothetical protein